MFKRYTFCQTRPELSEDEPTKEYRSQIWWPVSSIFISFHPFSWLHKNFDTERLDDLSRKAMWFLSCLTFDNPWLLSKSEYLRFSKIWKDPLPKFAIFKEDILCQHSPSCMPQAKGDPLKIVLVLWLHSIQDVSSIQPEKDPVPFYTNSTLFFWGSKETSQRMQTSKEGDHFGETGHAEDLGHHPPWPQKSTVEVVLVQFHCLQECLVPRRRPTRTTCRNVEVGTDCPIVILFLRRAKTSLII